MQKRVFVNTMGNCGWAESGFGNLAIERYGMEFRCQIRNKGYRIENRKAGSIDPYTCVVSGRYSNIKDANGVRNLI